MEVEVGGYSIAVDVVSRMLNRTKVVNLKFTRNDDHSAWMLTGRAFNTGTADGQTLGLSLIEKQASFLGVLLDVTESGLVGNGCNSSRLENVFGSEQGLGELMGARLILAREVKIDIRGLIPVEAEEGLEGNIVTVAYHIGVTMGAVLLRKVKSRAV